MKTVLRMFRSYLEQQLEFEEKEILLVSGSESERLAVLKKRVEECVLCPLSHTRKKIVLGEGNPHSSIVFIGEAPGREEDRKGKPFIGPAGQLLTKAIEALGLKREEVYIANVIKCRPPNNRVPRESEIASCLPYLLEQLGIINPSVVGLLGAVAIQSILKAHSPIFKVRGRIYSHSGMKLVPTYHPAALLRNPKLKKLFWKDMKLINAIYEEARSSRRDG